MLHVADVTTIPLIPRPSYEAMIVRGHPRAEGRILSLSADGRTARVVWRGTPGAYAFRPDPEVVDVGYIVSGRLAIHQAGQPTRQLGPGSLIEFPRTPFEMEITETFTKVSFLYHPTGLKATAEPLPAAS